MRILITNNTLADRGGSELYVRDLALRLQRRGHKPVAYSSVLGQVAEEMKAGGVPVIHDLAALTEAPDVIHGHHHLDAAAACLRFPRTPAVHACHGWMPWQEAPLVLASVRRYVAVSTLTREYLVTSGVAPERIEVIANFVDLERFTLRRDAGTAARRALVFSNQWAGEPPALDAIRKACDRCGLSLETFGAGFGHTTAQPEDLLPRFDVVFALGRSALEAMACGCAVVLAGTTGLGGLVTSDSFFHQRSANFGHALLTANAVTEDGVVEALQRIDEADVLRVAQLVHAHADINAAVDRWEEQYRLAMMEGPALLEEMTFSASKYLVDLKSIASRLESEFIHSAQAIKRLKDIIECQETELTNQAKRIEDMELLHAQQKLREAHGSHNIIGKWLQPFSRATQRWSLRRRG